MKGDIIMVSEVQAVSFAQITPKFMKHYDVSTASSEEARQIGEFLSNKDKRTARQAELAKYLLTRTKENGKAYTQDEAEKLAKYQVQNEMAQANSKVTIPFIDESAYNKAIAEDKEGLYNYTLIKDKEVLALINGDGIVDEVKKAENYKKYFKTDTNGELIKDEAGNYVFDGDKFKSEFVQDIGTDYKLQLSEREENARRRGISKSSEKNAIKAAGLDYRKDRTWLYRGLALGATAASLVWGGAAATAIAIASAGASAGSACGSSEASTSSKSVAKATNRTGQIIGSAVALASVPFIKDTYDGHKRPDAAEAFKEHPKNESIAIQPAKIPTPEIKIEPPKLVVEKPCYDIQESGKAVKTINYGGYWHYANLYNDCKTGKQITGKELQELTRLLKPGHENSSIQLMKTQVQGKNGKMRTVNKRVLQDEITLSNGTVVCLASPEVINARIAKMEADLAKKTHNGGAFKNDAYSLRVCDCDSGKQIGRAKTREEGVRMGQDYQTKHQRIRVVKK